MLTKTTPKSPKLLRWQHESYSPLRRQIDVFKATSQLMFYLGWDWLFQKKSSQIRKIRAQWLVKTLLDLGPTFIKIGQALSTRADLIPIEYIEELSQLQDQVPPFPVEDAIQLIESELKKSLYTLYRDFEYVPIASASLGQVHRAWLHTGEEVVVKVQRPGLKQLFDIDVQAVHRIIKILYRLFAWARTYNLEGIYQEFFTILYQEIDYIQEAKNAEFFRRNFNQYPQVIVPKVYWRYTTSKVLTVEYVPGIKIDDRPTLELCGLDPKKINQLGICCYLKQLLIDGFFQADPHPGNMAVNPDGRLIFYDFGMMSQVKSLAKDQMIKTFFAILRKDTDEVLETLIAMGLIEPVSDRTAVRRLIAFLLEKFTEKPVDFQAFTEIKAELYVMFEQQPFRLPAQMTFILKALTTLDGIARALDPQYNFVACAQPFIKSVTSERGRAAMVGELARQAQSFIQYRLQKPSPTVMLVRELEQRIEAGELKIRVRSLETERALKRINLALRSLIYACLTGFAFLSGTVLLVGGIPNWAMFVFGAAGAGFCLLIQSLIRLGIREKLDKIADQ